MAEIAETRRGAAGSDARSRIAETQRLPEEAESLVGISPALGLGKVRRAERLVEEMQALAQRDVEDVERSRSNGPDGRGSGASMGGLVRGGILVDSPLRGGRGGGFGGGWGGGC